MRSYISLHPSISIQVTSSPPPPPPMTRPSLLEAQTRALLTLLNLNPPPPRGTLEAPPPLVWKVLILDGASQDVLATSLRVQDLREQGVTLHMQLHSPRPPLTDVPAVYFVSPSPHNIRRIAADLNPPLYSAYYLAFTSALPRPLLEELASLILANDPSGHSAQLIASVTDQFLDFVVPSQNMFSLLPRRELTQDADGAGKAKKGREEWVEGRASYVVLNDPRATEVDIEQEVGRIANGLFSVVTTMSMSLAYSGIKADCGRHGTYHQVSPGQCGRDGRSSFGCQAA